MPKAKFSISMDQELVDRIDRIAQAREEGRATVIERMATNGIDYAGRLQNQTIPALDFISTALGGKQLGVSNWWVYISVSAGSALLALHVIGSIVADAMALKDPAARRPPAGVHGDSAL